MKLEHDPSKFMCHMQQPTPGVHRYSITLWPKIPRILVAKWREWLTWFSHIHIHLWQAHTTCRVVDIHHGSWTSVGSKPTKIWWKNLLQNLVTTKLDQHFYIDLRLMMNLGSFLLKRFSQTVKETHTNQTFFEADLLCKPERQEKTLSEPQSFRSILTFCLEVDFGSECPHPRNHCFTSIHSWWLRSYLKHRQAKLELVPLNLWGEHIMWIFESTTKIGIFLCSKTVFSNFQKTFQLLPTTTTPIRGVLPNRESVCWDLLASLRANTCLVALWFSSEDSDVLMLELESGGALGWFHACVFLCSVKNRKNR